MTQLTQKYLIDNPAIITEYLTGITLTPDGLNRPFFERRELATHLNF